MCVKTSDILNLSVNFAYTLLDNSSKTTIATIEYYKVIIYKILYSQNERVKYGKLIGCHNKKNPLKGQKTCFCP